MPSIRIFMRDRWTSSSPHSSAALFWVRLFFAVLFLRRWWVTAGALSLQLLSVACAPPHEKPLIPAWRSTRGSSSRTPPQPRHFRHSASLFLLLRDVTDLIQISAVSSVQAGKRDVTKEVGATFINEIQPRCLHTLRIQPVVIALKHFTVTLQLVVIEMETNQIILFLIIRRTEEINENAFLRSFCKNCLTSVHVGKNGRQRWRCTCSNTLRYLKWHEHAKQEIIPKAIISAWPWTETVALFHDSQHEFLTIFTGSPFCVCSKYDWNQETRVFFMYFNPSHKDFSHLDHIVFNAQRYESNKILKK